jgi:hypothetical protein
MAEDVFQNPADGLTFRYLMDRARDGGEDKQATQHKGHATNSS